MTDELSTLQPAFDAALPGYEVSSIIGRGVFGTVYGGVHRQLGRRVAVKLLRAETNEGNLRERFFQEARGRCLARRCAHRAGVRLRRA